MKKSERSRPYPPDYVSAETLAYRLDVSRATIDEYVRAGHLPKPHTFGNLHRWDFDEVRLSIKARNEALDGMILDPYFKGVERAKTTQN